MGEVRGALLQILKEAAEELMAQAQGSEGAESTYSTSCIRVVQHGALLISCDLTAYSSVSESMWTLTLIVTLHTQLSVDKTKYR